jgi:hypothetical protein
MPGAPAGVCGGFSRAENCFTLLDDLAGESSM